MVQAHFDGQLVKTLERRAEDVLRADLPRLSAAEAAVLVLIRERARKARASSATRASSAKRSRAA